MVNATTDEVRMPTIGTLLQLGQLLALIGGIIVVMFAIGKRDQILTDLVSGQAALRVELKEVNQSVQGVREKVAEIQGKIDSERK